jgi:hypothetical protein
MDRACGFGPQGWGFDSLQARFSLTLFLKELEIDHGEDSQGVENKDGDEPACLIIFTCFPHADGFPDSIPNNQQKERPKEAWVIEKSI